MTIPEILKSVLKARSEGIPESQIDEYLGQKGYTRKRFEEAVRYSIDKQTKKAGYQKALGDKWSPQFAGAVARELTNGILYEFGDEVEAFLRTLVTDETYDEAKNKINEERQTFQEMDPVATSLINLGGSLMGSGAEGRALATAGIPLVSKAGEIIGPKALQPVKGQPIRNVGRAATAAGGSGAIAGGITSYGQGTDPLAGMTVGAALSSVTAPAMDFGYAALQKMTSGSGGGGTVGPPSTRNDYNPNNRALRQILQNLEDDYGVVGDAAVQAARQNMQDRFVSAGRGQDAMLLDQGRRNLLKTADSLVMTPGPAATQVSDALFERQAGQRDRMIGSAEKGMGVGADPELFAQQMKETRDALSPRYQAIQNDLMRSPVYQQIYERDPRFADAQRSIQQNYGRAGEPTTGPIRTDQGIIRPGPYTLREIEDTRQGVGDMIDRRPVESGYVSGAERRSLSKNYSQMMDAADVDSPDYQQLRRAGYDTRLMQELNLKGYTEVPRMPPDRLQNFVEGRTEAEMNAMRSGFVQKLKDQMNEKTAIAGDRTRDWSSPNMQRRIEILFPTPEKYVQFQREMDAERRMSESAGYVLGNSRTAERLASQDELGGMTSQEAISAMRSGPLDIAAKGVDLLSNYFKRNNMRQMSEQLGPRMTARGEDAIEQQFRDLQNYRALQNQMAQERARRNMFLGGVGGIYGAGLLDD
jgi:hypothetical protein